jgi:hypothetical protein
MASLWVISYALKRLGCDLTKTAAMTKKSTV